MTTRGVTRRDFLRAGAAAGAGLTIAVHLPACGPAQSREITAPLQPNAWVRVRTDGAVLLIVDRSEMGQGVSTSLPQLLAEELDVAWDKVLIEQAPAGKVYFNAMIPSQVTGGSTSVRAAWKPLREAGATARAMLVQAAANAWSVDPAECTTENGVVSHATSRRRLPYGELVVAAAELPVPAKVTPKSPEHWRIIGKPMPRLDLAGKVTGSAVFGIDAGPEGAMVAVVARCPVFGGSAAKWNEAAAKAVPGVRHVVQVSSGVAVVADGYWAARKGRDALAVEWNEGAGARFSSDVMRQDAAKLARAPGAVAKRAGTGALAKGRVVTADYHAPYLAHACMEPMNATAHVEAGRCTVWAPTQYQCGPALGGGVQETAARIAGLEPGQVTVHTTLLGGGFGRRAMNDFVSEAVEASKAVGGPVKVIWSREDDIQHDFYRPATFARLAASLDEQGMPTGLTARFVCPSISAALFGAPRTAPDESAVEGFADHPYAVPNMLVDTVHPDWPVPIGFWRSVGASQNGFILESFIDELAAAAGKDPVEYRRSLLSSSPRHLAVLELAARQAGWGSPLPDGRARGVALVKSFDSYVAQVAEVSLGPDRTPRVHRVVCAVDCGRVVNPDGVRAQVESAVVYGLTAALYGEITIAEGRVVQTNFDSYPMLRMREMPVVEVHMVESTEDPTGMGEPGTPPIAPAVANAVYALTKQRIRSLPLRTVPA
jgi:isoquinoline 1-oxidoreductase subunit beta